MKNPTKFLTAVVVSLLLLVLCVPFALAQSPLTSAQTLTTSTTGALAGLNETGYQAGTHALTFVKTGTVATCTVQLETSSDGITYALMPTSAAQTCTATGAYTVTGQVANYVRINNTALTGTGSVAFTLTSYPNTPASSPIAGNVVASPPFPTGMTVSLGAYQGTTSVGITDTAFHALIAAASDIKIPANSLATAGKAIRVRGTGVYTNAAASLLNGEAMLCQVSGCASGTVVAPAGCAIVTTNQANNLANGQFTIDCILVTTSTLGASGTFMAKGVFAANLGAAATAVLSPFADQVVAVSAAVDETKDEFVNVGFKFSTSNAGNSAILHTLTVEYIN